jgi:DNA polymerase-3 subunit chi
MPRADFYLIDKPRFRADPLLLVCELARRAFHAQQPTLVLVRSEQEAEALDALLWEFDEEAFIPHQVVGEAEPEEDAVTAVLIVPPGRQTPDRPLVINLREDCAPGRFERVLEVVPADDAERAGSRRRWQAYREAGFEVLKHDM